MRPSPIEMILNPRAFAASSPILRLSGPRVEEKPPLLSVESTPENTSAPAPPLESHVLSLAETPPITESSTFVHASTEAGSGKETRVAALGVGVSTLRGGELIVVVDDVVEVDVVESVAVESEEHAPISRTLAPTIAKSATRMSVLAAFA